MTKKSTNLISASFKGPIPGGMVSAPQAIAVEEGAKVLQNGGNAMDAAVTTAFVQGVVDRTNCGVGGFGMMNVYIAETGEEMMLDFHGKAGSKVVPDMWKDIIIQENPSGYGYTIEGGVNEKGYTSITTPGTISGLHGGLTRYGTISWAEAIQPALELARDGFEVSQATAKTWTSAPEGQTSPWIKIKDVPETGGAVIANKDMAETFRKLAEGGQDIFYRGEIAERIAADMEANGGFVTLKDLNDYRTTISEPLKIDYRGYTIATNAPPGGGLTIIQALNILEEYHLAKMGHNSAEYIYIVSMAMKAAFADWANYLGDRAFVDIPMGWLMSKERAYEWKKKIDSGESITIPRWRPKESPDTTHVSVMDSAGNAVALTHSLGASAGVVTPPSSSGQAGLGFYYNNCMNCFNPVPGKPNSILPGKSRLTGMSPTIVKKDGKPFFVVGSPGGTRIVTGNLQSILNVIDHKMSATEAVFAARFDCQSDVIDAQARIPLSICEQVRAKGHPIRRTFSSFGGVALVHGILVNSEKGILEGGADPAGGGMALYVPTHP